MLWLVTFFPFLVFFLLVVVALQGGTPKPKQQPTLSNRQSQGKAQSKAGQGKAMGSGYSKTISDLEKNDGSKAELDFSDSNLGDSKLQKLGEALHKNTSVQASIALQAQNTNTQTRARTRPHVHACPFPSHSHTHTHALSLSLSFSLFSEPCERSTCLAPT